ncbi:MOSC domain-containing protein [Citromicrobium bathyomarinum]
MAQTTVPSPRVLSVSQSGGHRFSKQPVERIELERGRGVRGDAHAGERVQHLSRVRADPTQRNLRQVHLIHGELLEQLSARGFCVNPGDLGENITTRGIDLLALPKGTLLEIGAGAVLEVTGLRNPCRQIEAFEEGLLAAVLDRTSNGAVIRKTGIMSVEVAGGTVAIGDSIRVRLPVEPHLPLEPV